ncbi:LCP family protein [Sanguibacter inulinus]|nr:LCP family protein [Sanguibacter inulinus]
MTSSDAPERATRRSQQHVSRVQPAHAVSFRRHRVAKVVALTLTGVFAFAATAAGTVYYKMQNNITQVDTEDLLAEAERPAPPTPDPDDPYANAPVNILLIGSDDRSGENASLGGEAPGMRSDTTMILHISGDRTRVEVISIPRDTLVDTPECQTTNGTVPAQRGAMFNSAFAYGWDKGQDLASAATCTILTVEKFSGTFIDGFVVVDFAGFVSMVDALGGVPITIDEPIDAPQADLVLEAGPQTLNGTQALGLARARKGAGLDGSDLKRIERQQDLLTAMSAAVLGQNLLTDTPKLLQFLNAATSSLSASPEFSSLQNLAGLALSLKGVNMDNITFMTPPLADAPTNKNRVIFTSGAEDVWERLRNDQPIEDPDPTEAPVEEGTDVVLDGTADQAVPAP